MATVMEETKSRETAVQAHTALETEIENLTSNLFTEANKMVAFERLARARAEEKTRTVEEAEVSMQALLEEVQVGLKDTVLKLEARDAQVADLKRRLAAHGEHVEEDENVTGDRAGENDLGGIVFSDGERLAPLNTRNLSVGGPGSGGSGSVSPSPMSAPKLLTSVLPYQEFLAFINYLRQTRVTALSKPPEHSSYPALTGRSFASDPIPAAQLTPDQLLAPHLLLSTHLSQAFLKRCVEEDSDPALRLDLAPGLGFLSRRSVATAIVDGSLVIEPLHSSNGGGDLPSDKCSLCGCSLERWLPNSGILRGTKPTTTAAQSAAASVNSTMRKISSSFFSRSASSSHLLSAASPASTSAPPLPPRATRNHSRTPSASEEPISFLPASTAASHHPHDAFLLIHTFRTSDKSQSQRYTVCPSYCLPRLRAVCEFWTYVRVLLRGLLLEESFRFGQAGVNNNGSTTPTPTTPARTGSVANGLGITELAPGETAAAPTTALADEGIEAKDFEAEDTHGQEQQLEKEDKEEGEKGEEGESRGAVEDKADKAEEVEGEGSGENGEQRDSGAPERNETGTEEKEKKEKGEDGDKDTTPGTPTLATDSASVSRSGSVKPPRPARSSARNSPRPPSNPSLPGSPIVPTDENRPVLPPRRQTGEGVSTSALPPPPPRHPSHAVTVAESPAAGSGSSGSGWEDRCWGEVVRLKEAVFWTRVAAVAADGEAVSSRGAKVWS